MPTQNIEKDHTEAEIVDFAKQFATNTVRTLSGMLSADLETSAPEYCSKGISSTHNFYISVLFTGTVFGEFILALDEETGAQLIGNSFADKSNEEKADLRHEVADTFSELLNMIAGESVVGLTSRHNKLTITAPKVHFGQVRYPQVKSGRVILKNEFGEIDCFVYIDKMKLDIAASYKKALSSLLVANKELQVAMKQLQDQQAQIVQSEKLAALGTMAAGVAHEINTPLATISMVEGQMKELLGDEQFDKEEFRSMLDLIDSTISRISKVTGALRAYANDFAGSPYLPTSISDIVENAIFFCEAQIMERQIKIIQDPALASFKIECREAQFTQVLFSLISNACDAVKDLSDRWIKIDCVDKGDDVEIRITDSGTGIPSELKSKIFDPFYTTKEVGKGSGLGLSLARGITNSHRGSLYLNSRAENTQFVVHVPKSQTPANGDSADKSPVEKQSKAS